MAGEIPLAIVGNLTADPEVRFTASGAAVCSFTVASTPRTYNKNSNSWEDGEPTFMPVTVWKQMAENVAESFAKGDRVMVIGTLTTRSWQDGNSGEKRSRNEMRGDSVGPDVKFKTVTINRAQRQQGGGQAPPSGDPWGQDPPPQGNQRSQRQQASQPPLDEEPPF
jgi:single-strand DNA-binding protein